MPTSHAATTSVACGVVGGFRFTSSVSTRVSIEHTLLWLMRPAATFSSTANPRTEQQWE